MYLGRVIQLLMIALITAEEQNDTHLVVQPRIYGGQITTQGELGGYAVQILSDGDLICTGCLLSEIHVLTAAHCFDKSSYRNFYLVAGETYVVNYPGNRNYVADAIISPEYSKYSFTGDIAVLRATNRIRGSNIGYLPLCSVRLFGGLMVTVAGWGQTDGWQTNALRSMVVPMISKDECSQQISRWVPQNAVCAAGYNGKTICFGDSGGPLVYNGELCGISTWTYGCGNHNKPDVYMNVYYYRSFIENAMRRLRD